MPPAPVEVALTVRPRARIDTLDVRRRVSETHGDALDPFPLALYSSYHTTAGYLDQSLATRLNRKRGGLGSYLSFFRQVFPEGAGYKHDQLDLREELSEAERRTEPLNADSHLAFISAGLRNCVTYRGRNGEPVYFIDLDGVYRGRTRQRVTTVLGYSTEEEVARDRVTVPMSAHPVDAVSLKDPRLGVFERCDELIRRHGVDKGRVQLALAPGEEQAGLTVNEYETLLMRHDLAEVLRNPLRFMAENSRDLLSDPRSIPNKTIGYAQVRPSADVQRAVRRAPPERLGGGAHSVPILRRPRPPLPAGEAFREPAGVRPGDPRHGPSRAGTLPEPDPDAVAAERAPRARDRRHPDPLPLTADSSPPTRRGGAPPPRGR